MTERLNNLHENILLRRVPDVPREQTSLFSPESLRAKEVFEFNYDEIMTKMQASEGKRIRTIDIGGSKVLSTLYQIRSNSFEERSDTSRLIETKNGTGILPFLDSLGKFDASRNTPVGISTTGILQGTKLITATRIPDFQSQLQEKSSDFKELFPTLKSVVNDGVAGTIGGSFEAVKDNNKALNTLFFINGSGIGGAVMKDGKIWAIEPGHVEVIQELNEFDQKSPCPFYNDETKACMANCAGGRSIENIWKQKTGEDNSAEEIGNLAQDGNELAIKIFESSANISASAIIGIMDAFELEKQNTAIVFHGGLFNNPSYGERIAQRLDRKMNTRLKILYTKTFEKDACLTGAAIAALNSPT